jgi:hypothetical protein
VSLPPLDRECVINEQTLSLLRASLVLKKRVPDIAARNIRRL